MRVIVLVADQNALARAAHAMLLIVLLQASQSVLDGWVLLWLRLFRAESIVAERIQTKRGLAVNKRQQLFGRNA